MNDESKDLAHHATRLPPSERLKLIEKLLDSLDAPDHGLDRAWAGESKERLAAYRRGELDAIPIAEVLAKYKDG